jgi:AraC-like DNA-binding protein
MPKANSGAGINSLIPVLQSQVIPCWERYGTDRLAITTKTRKQFQAKEPPELVRTSIKKRVGKKTPIRNSRTFNNTSPTRELWMEDDQAIFLYSALVFIVSGQADFHVADYAVHVPQSHFLFFHKDVPRPLGYRVHLEGEIPSRVNSVLWFFAPPGTNSVIAYICHSEGEKHWSEGYNIVHRPEVLSLYNTLVREIEERGKFIDLCFRPFLHFYLRELQQGQFHRTSSVSSPHRQKYVASPIEQAQQYIKTHLNEHLTAESVAAQVYMSRRNFLHHWSQESRQSFHDFVTAQRMEEAGRILQDGYWSVSQLCSFIGLQPTQFRTQFKTYFGVNPSKFRGKLSNSRKSAQKR